jgi:hypothetical protein
MNLTPEQLQGAINAISEDLYESCQEMAQIAERKGVAWLELRAACKTNGEADKLWDASPDGRRENHLKWAIKGLQAKRGALILEHKSNSGIL